MKTLEKAIEEARDSLIVLNGCVCSSCGSRKEITVDHIIPKSWLLSFGISQMQSFLPKNRWLLQLLCKRCNILKMDRLDWNNPKTKEVLIKLIEDI